MLRKAVIPIAGKGTRLLPVTSILPKALFPIVLPEKRISTILYGLLADVCRAGIDEVCLIVSPGHKEMIINYFKAASEENDIRLPLVLEFVEQAKPLGFGHAVMQAKEFVGDAQFLLLLGDHVHVTHAGQASCIRQVIKAFQEQNGCKAMIGMHDVDEMLVNRMGTAAGRLIGERLFRCVDFVEKPDVETARMRLTTDGLPQGKYLAHCGIYAFDTNIFDCLEEERLAVEYSAQEIELAAAQIRLLERYPESYYLYWIDGIAYDMGNPEGYLRMFAALGGLSV